MQVEKCYLVWLDEYTITDKAPIATYMKTSLLAN